ncbi:MAG: UPF0758 domain-containing protein [Verrucomicrobiota bacterium]
MQPSIRIKDLPGSERPRERLAQQGAEALRNADLLAILLRTGHKGFSAIQLAERLLARFRKLGSAGAGFAGRIT